MAVTQDPEAWTRLGVKVREAREAQGLSRKRLAEIAGVSEKSIQVAEEGRTPRARWPQSLTLIESALGWVEGSMAHILEGGEPSLGRQQAIFPDFLDNRVSGVDSQRLATSLPMPSGFPEDSSTHALSTALARAPRQIRNHLPDVLNFGRRCLAMGADGSIVEAYESSVNELLMSLLTGPLEFEGFAEGGELEPWRRATRMDPVLRQENKERVMGRRSRPPVSSEATLRRNDEREEAVVVGGTDSEGVLRELRKLASEVAQLKGVVREVASSRKEEGKAE